MAYPTAIVSIAFNDGPYVANPTWTDVSSYVRSLSTDRSRDDDWGNFTGSASVELDNRSRIFDPFYTSGTYYGKLLPRRQIKIEAFYGGSTYPVFRGYIDGWPPTWTNAGKDSTVTLQCYDALSLLSQVQLPADWSRQYIINTFPRHYYACDDPIIPFAGGVLTDSGFTPKSVTVQTWATSGQQLATGLVNRSLAGNPTNAVDNIATNDPGSGSRVPVFTAESDFSVSAWVIPESVTGSGALFWGETGFFQWYVGFISGKFVFQVNLQGNFNNFWSTTTTTLTLNAAEPQHIAVAWTASTKTAAIYVNGVNVTGTRTVSTQFLGSSSADILTVVVGPIQQIVIWTYALTSTVIQEIVKLSSANFYETTTQRVARIIAQTSFPASLVTASGTQYILDLTDDAPYAGPELQITAQTEGGPLYVNRSGQIIQQSLYEQFTTAKAFTSQTTYGSTGTALQPEITIGYDASSMRNALSVSMSQGGVIKTTGTVATTVYGESTQDWSTYAPTYAQAKLVGNVLVGFGQYVFPKLEDFEVVLSGSNDWTATLGLELIERITVKIQPPTGNLITEELQLSSIKHSVVPGQWTTVLNGSARWASSFRINTSFINGDDVIVYA